MAALCDFSLGRYDESLRGLLRARTLGISRTPDVATVVRYHAGILLTRFGDFELGMSILAEPGQDVSESPPMITAFGLNTLRRPVLPSEMSANERPMVELAGRATLAAVARRASEARAAFDELVAHYPQVSHVHYARGVFLLSSEPDLAIADFERELGVTPNHLLARVQIAFEQLRRGEFDRARPYAVAAVRLDAKHPVARLALGQVELEAGSVDAAVTELETAVRLAPESAQAHFVLARAYARAGRTADAERERKEFARLDRVARPR
jgi:tetratricopeptide (TPR) repeat protein